MQDTSAAALAGERRAASLVSAAAGLIVLAAALVFLADSTWYGVFKALHVVAAVLWVGGGTLLTILALAAQRANDNERLLQIGRQAEWAARLFVPASFVVLGFGIAMTINADVDWGAFWIVFGLIAWAFSAAVGIFYLTPQIKKLNALADARGIDDPETQRLLNRIVTAARLDVAFLFLIVIDMTVKPFS